MNLLRHIRPIGIAIITCSLIGLPSLGLTEETTPPKGPTTESPNEGSKADEAAAKSEPPAPVTLEDISIVSTRPQERPQGTAIASAPREEMDLRPTRNFLESLQAIPGITTQQGNGPRDFNISIRGFGGKNAFGIRNVKMYEDGISQTQSDGLSRLDLHDPWFMQSVEVLRGPSSSQYDNYALGGVLFFRTRRGSDLMGAEADVTLGSFGYQKYALGYGANTPNTDVALFVSRVTEDGYLKHSDYSTTTENLNFRYQIDDRQNIYFKAINNYLDAHVPTRLTLNQFEADPRQAGGLGSTTPESLAQSRKDRRTILGALYERQIDNDTLLTMEGDFDLKDIYQPFNQIFAAVNPNFKHYTDLRHDGQLFGAPLRSTMGFFVNYMEQEAQTFQNLNDFQGTRGTLLQDSHGSILNIGARARGEWEFIPRWTAAAGLGVEKSAVKADIFNYTNAGAFKNSVSPDRTYKNYAPEVSLTHHADRETKQWIRASTGYAIPGIGNLTTDLTGAPGVNTSLKPQTDIGLEVGSDTSIGSLLSLQLVGFWTNFKNEIITQSNAIGSYSINADRSEYRGLETGARVKPFEGARITTAYTFIDANYRKFDDQYVVAGAPAVFSRDGKEVPAVVKNVFYAQAAYDHSSGLGAWIETRWTGDYFADNANTLKASSYAVMNANMHYILAFAPTGMIRFVKTFIEMDNIFNRSYIGSTAVVSDSPCGASPTFGCMSQNAQSFFAGNGRAVYAGATVGF